MADREHREPATETGFVPAVMNTPQPIDEIREVAEPKPNGPLPYDKVKQFANQRASTVSTIAQSPMPMSPELHPASDPFVDEPLRISSHFEEDITTTKMSRR